MRSRQAFRRNVGLKIEAAVTFSAHAFSEAGQAAVYRAIRERRDMRHFCGGEIPDAQLQRLLQAAHHAPSVGFMQPWRFIRVRKPLVRQQLHDLVDAERLLTADALGKRRDDFMKLKVQGIMDAAEVLVVALPSGREQHIFGRAVLCLIWTWHLPLARFKTSGWQRVPRDWVWDGCRCFVRSNWHC